MTLEHKNNKQTNLSRTKEGIIDGVAVSQCDMRSYRFGAVTSVAGPSLTIISFYYHSWLNHVIIVSGNITSFIIMHSDDDAFHM